MFQPHNKNRTLTFKDLFIVQLYDNKVFLSILVWLCSIIHLKSAALRKWSIMTIRKWSCNKVISKNKLVCGSLAYRVNRNHIIFGKKTIFIQLYTISLFTTNIWVSQFKFCTIFLHYIYDLLISHIRITCLYNINRMRVQRKKIKHKIEILNGHGRAKGFKRCH